MNTKTTDRLTAAERAEFHRAIAEGTPIRRHLAVKAFAELAARPADTRTTTQEDR